MAGLPEILKNPEVPAGVAGPEFAMGYGGFTVHDMPGRRNHLVDGAGPAVGGMVADEALPVIGEGGAPLAVEGRVIGQHDDVGVGGQGALEFEKAPAVGLFDHVVCV